MRSGCVGYFRCHRGLRNHMYRCRMVSLSNCFISSNNPKVAVQVMLTIVNTSTLFDMVAECLNTVLSSPMQQAPDVMLLASDTMKPPFHCIGRWSNPRSAYNCLASDTGVSRTLRPGRRLGIYSSRMISIRHECILSSSAVATR
jgi:hypothetical protein